MRTIDELLNEDEVRYAMLPRLQPGELRNIAHSLPVIDPDRAAKLVHVAAAAGEGLPAVSVLLKAAHDSRNADLRLAAATAAKRFARAPESLSDCLANGLEYQLVNTEVRRVLLALESDKDEDIVAETSESWRFVTQKSRFGALFAVLSFWLVYVAAIVYGTAASFVLLVIIPETMGVQRPIEDLQEAMIVSSTLLALLACSIWITRIRPRMPATPTQGDWTLGQLVDDVVVFRFAEPGDKKQHLPAPIERYARKAIRWGLSGNVTGFLGLAFVAAASAAMLIEAITPSNGYLLVPTLLLVPAFLLDGIDGPVAHMTTEELSVRNRYLYLDYLIDRVSDVLVAGSLFAFLSRTAPHLVYLAGSLGALSILVSYVRAEGGRFGLETAGGPFERWLRMLLTMGGLAAGAISLELLVYALVAAVGVSTFTAVVRITRGYRTAPWVLGVGVAHSQSREGPEGDGARGSVEGAQV